MAVLVVVDVGVVAGSAAAVVDAMQQYLAVVAVVAVVAVDAGDVVVTGQ